MADFDTDRFLDITAYVCPMTFVRTKLLIERMKSGETATIRLNSGEPLSNVPRSVREHGHQIISLEPAPDAGEDGPYHLILRKV